LGDYDKDQDGEFEYPTAGSGRDPVETESGDRQKDEMISIASTSDSLHLPRRPKICRRQVFGSSAIKVS
jgi:hypothetical protein